MAEHSFTEAKAMGFRAMQYNFVVSTNEIAVKLWEKLGFKIIGTIPEGFHHQQQGYVDAHVMWKRL
jgi:ribosomal protein S18 acetylase RimI-like enzyme